jgi:hypothetical protein
MLSGARRGASRRRIRRTPSAPISEADVPAIVAWNEFTASGGLTEAGANSADAFRVTRDARAARAEGLPP